ncbi:hypothetical protein G647_02606 [Cladophialophora carrionii CBS 160.54]|uniref:WLM domain-containing protein n=1 Tax=Cladophialophora carrionii CBS 160.54 TaxID=1279043 RepID=V9DG12_9EURO|nr:uncharacterized protein G647_02606 [Cladophialophora carrionii CBS 160.54]ETI25829.1 hypothetical protein G647_02606 [Cladophialophora carrionii CBS 160.54]
MSQTRGTELDPLVDQFQHLTSKARPNEALNVLKRVASLVKPIMRVRGWRVGVLAEFYPDEHALLGLNTNRGEAIHLRLRYPSDDRQFLPFENIVDTMLHELSHIVHGPHDQAFHALWDKLRDEHEALLRKGYTGEGFLGKGNRLGGRGIPRSELQRQARAAAERRGRNAVLAQGSGTKLGGKGILRGQDAREIIAAAAERRNRVNRGCGNTVPDMGRKLAQEQAIKKEKVATTQAEKADEDEAALMQAYIEMIQEEEAQLFGAGYIPPSRDNPTGGFKQGNTVQPPTDMRKLREEQLQIERQLREKPESNTSTTEYEPGSKPNSMSKPKPASNPTSAPPPPPARLPHEEQTWTCEICTLINPITYLLCGACETERPPWFNPPSPPPSSSTLSSTSNARAKSSKPQPHNVLASRNAADNIARFESAAKQKAQTNPVGWTCGQCGNWMESQWWTCSMCGRMKASS